LSLIKCSGHALHEKLCKFKFFPFKLFLLFPDLVDFKHVIYRPLYINFNFLIFKSKDKNSQLFVFFKHSNNSAIPSTNFHITAIFARNALSKNKLAYNVYSPLLNKC